MANVGHRAFATLQIELHRVVDYDSNWSTKFHKDCVGQFFFISFKASFDNVFLIFKIVLGPMSGTELFQIELYRVVYDIKFTKFHKDCMFDLF